MDFFPLGNQHEIEMRKTKRLNAGKLRTIYYALTMFVVEPRETAAPHLQKTGMSRTSNLIVISVLSVHVISRHIPIISYY